MCLRLSGHVWYLWWIRHSKLHITPTAHVTLWCVVYRTHQTYEFGQARCSTYQTPMIKFFCTWCMIFPFGCLHLLEKSFSSSAYKSFNFLTSKTWFQSFPKQKCVVYFWNKLFYRREFLSSMLIVTQCHICYRHTYFLPNLVK